MWRGSPAAMPRGGSHAEAMPSDREVSAPAPASPASGERVLIVDDEESILEVVGEYLSRRGYFVRTAARGKDALSLLEREPIDCCLTDIHMPEMSGLELAERIHARDNTLPVIVMTAYPSLEASIRTVRSGVLDFLVKPFDLKQMELSLRRVLRERALYTENLLLKQEVRAKERLEALNRELLSKVEELNTLNRILTGLTAEASPGGVFQRTAEIAREAVGADQAVFYVLPGAGEEPVALAASPPFEGREERIPAGLREAAGAAAGEGRAVLHAAAQGAGDPAPVFACRAATPVFIRGTLFGVLAAGVRPGGRSFDGKDLEYLGFTARTAAGAIENLALYENLHDNLFATLYGFVHALEARDLYTRQHSSRVTRIALVLGETMGCSRDELNVLQFAGPLHDIGKIGIRDEILLKPGRLTSEEFEKIKEHPVIGANMLSQIGLWEEERRIIRCHHERFDGRGYPEGLRGEEIPFLARLLSLADAYDAMASDRAYRRRMEEGAILEIIHGEAGGQFDPAVVCAFEAAWREGKLIALTASAACQTPES